MPYVIVVIGYIGAFALLSLSLTNGVPLGIAYAIWAGIVLVVGGIGLLELGGKS